MEQRSNRLTISDRMMIERMLAEGLSVSKIASTLERSRQSIYRELRRCKGAYSAREAQNSLGRKIS